MADYTYDEVMTALRNADAAGDTAAAQQLAEIANRLSSAEEGSYLAEAARKGITRLPSQIYGAFKGAITGEGQTGARKYAEESQRSMMEAMGGTGAKPKTIGQRIIAAGVEGATAPETYVLPSAKFIEGAGMLAKPALKAVEGAVTGSGAEAGGTAGEFAGRKIGGEEGASAGRVAGGLLGGVSSSVALGTAPRMAAVTADVAAPVVNKVKEFFKSAAEKTPDDQYMQAANRHIENIFLAAASSDPNFLKVLDEAAAAQAATGVKLPINALLKDNPVLNNYIASLASSNPEFRKLYSSNFEAAQAAMKERAAKMFGDPTKAGEVISKEKGVDIAGAVSRRQAGLMRQAEIESRGVKPVDPAAFGAKVVEVTDAAENAARESTKPLYAEAFKLGRSKGVQLPEEAVADIYGYVVGEKANDIFKTFPSIYGKVASAFKPKLTEGANLVDASGRPIGSQTGNQFASASLEDLDSLKREINAQLRKTRTDSEIRLLTELKGKVNSHINNLDPEFVAAYRGADQAYLERVGLPFNEETINMIGRAKFDENVVPLLTKNKSTLSQFIDATGEQGKQLAEQAFISDLHKNAVKDGVLVPGAVKAWMKRNESALSLVPDVKAKIEQMSGNVQDVLNAKSALDSKFIRNAQSRIAEVEGMSPQQIVNKLYSDSTYADKLLGSLNKTLVFSGQQAISQDGLKAVRSFLLDDIISSKNPIELLGDRTKSAVYNRVFGPTYANQVKQLAVVADRLVTDPANVVINAKTIDKDFIEALTGSSPQRAYSLLVTNPVISKEVALIALFNRYFNKQASDRAAEEMQKVLLDTELSAKIFRSLQARGKINFEEFKQASEMAAKKFGINFAETLAKDIRAGAVRSGQAFDSEEEQQ